MLYGPNTNLGHNSIVYMLESQIAHVMRCLRTMRRDGAREIDVDARATGASTCMQQRLEGSVWNSCKSWYVDASGHNSTNWPGFTLTYRWITRFTGMGATASRIRCRSRPHRRATWWSRRPSAGWRH